MQTFVPYPDFVRSARVLDYKRLGKQRSETMIIWNTLTGEYDRTGRKGWPHHPAVKMWAGHADALLHYGLEICSEWNRRGFEDTGTLDWFASRIDWSKEAAFPFWWGREDVHQSHRSQLLQKWAEYYRDRFPKERADMGYVWPVA